MTRRHNKGGVKVDFTPEEETARDAEELAWDNAKPIEDWKQKIAGTDAGMPRYLEDLITDKFAGDAGTSLQERYDKKIKIRGERP